MAELTACLMLQSFGDHAEKRTPLYSLATLMIHQAEEGDLHFSLFKCMQSLRYIWLEVMMGAFCSLSLTKQCERVRTAGQTFACFMLQ